MSHSNALTAAAQAIAHGETSGPSWDKRYRIASAVEWSAILCHALKHNDQEGVAMAHRALTGIVLEDEA